MFVIGEPGLFGHFGRARSLVQQPDGLLYALHVQRVQKGLAGDRFKAPAQIAGGYPHLFREGFNAQALLAVRGNAFQGHIHIGVLLADFFHDQRGGLACAVEQRHQAAHLFGGFLLGMNAAH